MHSDHRLLSRKDTNPITSKVSTLTQIKDSHCPMELFLEDMNKIKKDSQNRRRNRNNPTILRDFLYLVHIFKKKKDSQNRRRNRNNPTRLSQDFIDVLPAADEFVGPQSKKYKKMEFFFSPSSKK